MMRTNSFAVRPLSEQDEQLLRELLDASASLWNELNYQRRQRFFEDKNVWEHENKYGRYKDTLGSATAQQIKRENDSAWRSFFKCLESGERASPPGYCGNSAEGRDLRTFIRADQYTLETGERSRLEIPVGQRLKDKYGIGYNERLRLEVSGRQKWKGDPGRLELHYDEVSDTFRALQPVTVPDSRQDSPLADYSAALDVGANNLVACSTTTGQQYLYEGRGLFKRFRDTTEEIARLQAKLDDQRRTSQRIDRLYRRRTRRRNHAQDALVRDLVERLHDEGVATIYVGDLRGVLAEHWSARVNEKTHAFWAFRRFTDRLVSVAEEFGLTVEVRSEAWTTEECPQCGEREDTNRSGDLFQCRCGYEGHADLAAARTFLEKEVSSGVGPMARPVRLEWDNHDWRSTTDAQRPNPKEERTDRSTRRQVGKFATADSS